MLNRPPKRPGIGLADDPALRAPRRRPGSEVAGDGAPAQAAGGERPADPRRAAREIRAAAQGQARAQTQNGRRVRPAPRSGVRESAPAARTRPNGRPAPQTELDSARRPAPGAGHHPLTDRAANERLWDYEQAVRGAFERIVPTLKGVSALKYEPDFETQAQTLALRDLGFELPEPVLADAWVSTLDLKGLYAWCVFQTYRRLADGHFGSDPAAGGPTAVADFERFLLECGFHSLDVTPCADGRLAHSLSAVLRLPRAAVKRRPHAGGLFDVETAVASWVEVELARFREGRPNFADAPTRYLKAVVYHRSSLDPAHQGCAAHGSDDARAAAAAFERLQAFRQAVQNGFCCGASVDLLPIGLDTDTDAIRVHVPDAQGNLSPDRCVEAMALYGETAGLSAESARVRICDAVRAAGAGAGTGQGTGAPADGTVRFIARLIENNLSQIDYVRRRFGGHYSDAGHAERFIAAGSGFEEIELRNLTYFAYLDTVEEGAADLDVGIRIFRGLNVTHGLPVPVVVRFDYRGSVPGSRERAAARCERVYGALAARYPDLSRAGLLHVMRAVRDSEGSGSLEPVGCTVLRDRDAGGH